LNAANEIAVNGFLNNQISFNDISVLVETTLMNINHIDNPTIDDIVNTNIDSRNFTTKLLNNN
jgi:1-deoxy-D-xylulose-5-phosphate reductoisomerase